MTRGGLRRLRAIVLAVGRWEGRRGKKEGKKVKLLVTEKPVPAFHTPSEDGRRRQVGTKHTLGNGREASRRTTSADLPMESGGS